MFIAKVSGVSGVSGVTGVSGVSGVSGVTCFCCEGLHTCSVWMRVATLNSIHDQWYLHQQWYLSTPTRRKKVARAAPLY